MVMRLRGVSATAIAWMRRITCQDDFQCISLRQSAPPAPGLSAACRQSLKRDPAARVNEALCKWSVEAALPLEPAVFRISSAPVETLEALVPAAEEPAVPESAAPETTDLQLDQNSQTYLSEDDVPEPGYPESEQTQMPNPNLATDYYEILQISRNADMETIHRVYRMMALRFHPDNPRTGDVERFLLLNRAYQVLSDPGQRAEYDTAHQNADAQPLPIFELKDFVYGIEGEMNRRLGILSLLYHRRRLGETRAGISVLDLEKQMAFPREHLNFTLWYLRAKGYVTLEENSDYALTSQGVDYVEANATSNRVIRELLTRGSGNEAAGNAGVLRSGAPAGTTSLVPLRVRPRGSARLLDHRRRNRRTAGLEHRPAV
jgi:curved DNA-binding protein CbpA